MEAGRSIRYFNLVSKYVRIILNYLSLVVVCCILYSDCYDEQRLKEIINMYESFMRAGDNDSLIFHLRANLMRNNFGVGHPRLFDYALDGTKILVEKYMHTVCKAIKSISYNAQVLVYIDMYMQYYNCPLLYFQNDC